MSEMQSDTATVAMDTESNIDTTQSVAGDNPVSTEQHQPMSTGDVTATGTGSAGEVRTENTADDATDDANSGDAGDTVVAASELDDSATQQLLTSTDNDTGSLNPVNVSSTDEAATSADNDGDADGDNDGLPAPASGPSSTSASVGIQSCGWLKKKQRKMLKKCKTDLFF